MINLQGLVIIVIGGSRGLGAAIVRVLARQGADVAFTYAENKAAARRLVEEIEGTGRRCFAIQADARNFDAAHRVVIQVREKLGGLHALVSNAGASRSAAVWKMTEADWDEVMDISFKSAFNYLHAVAPIFMEQKQGKVVCIGSINGLRGRVGSLSYNVAKAGLTGLVKTAAAELGRFDVNVNLVAPGFIETPSQKNTPELVRDLVLKECAIKRLGTPDDIAPVVAFLCSEEARHVTGQILKVDAGQYL